MLNLFTGIMTGSTILNVLMALSFFLWHFMLLFVIAMVCTRNLFAWSVDRVLPDAVTKVDRRFHAPWVATLIIVAAAEILLALYVFTSVFDKVSNYIVLFSIAFWMASFAAILLPYRRREIFAAAPDYVQRRIGNVPRDHAARRRQPDPVHDGPLLRVQAAGVQRPDRKRGGAVRDRRSTSVGLSDLLRREGDPAPARHRLDLLYEEIPPE